MKKEKIKELIVSAVFSSNQIFNNKILNQITLRLTKGFSINNGNSLKELIITKDECLKYLDKFINDVGHIEKLDTANSNLENPIIFKIKDNYEELVNTVISMNISKLVPSGQIGANFKDKKYSIKTASLEVLIKALLNANVEEIDPMFTRFITSYFNNIQNAEGIKVLDISQIDLDPSQINSDEAIYFLLSSIINRNLTVLCLSSANPNSMEDIEVQQRLSSMLFNLNFERYKIRLSENYEDFLGLRNISSNTHKELSKISLPRKVYNEALLHLYSAANWSDNPFTQYISYYQIIERKFSQIHKDNLVKLLQGEISRPDFEINNKNEIYKIEESIIAQSNDSRKEENQLKDVIKNYFPNKDNFVVFNKKLSKEQLEYYLKRIPEFLDKNMKNKLVINFDSENLDKIYNPLVKRIYTIRTALVHNKEGRANNYDPTADYSSLVKEVPLIRIVAENIILNSSDEYLS